MTSEYTTGDALCTIGFQGLRHPEVAGDIDLRAREHSPRLGRFLQRDPLGYPDGMNTYAAYHVMWGGVDPYGEAAWLPRVAWVVGREIGKRAAAPIASAATRRMLAGQMARQAAAQQQRAAAAGARHAAAVAAAAAAEAARRNAAKDAAADATAVECARGRGKGERNKTGRAKDTGNPYKHTRPHPTDSTKILEKDPQTGKWKTKPKPKDYPK